MIGSLARKARHVLQDPVLQRWLCRRVIGRETGPPAFTPGHPPYLALPDGLPTRAPTWSGPTAEAGFQPPREPICIALAGRTVEIPPDQPERLFSAAYDDLETALSAHRFAWVPVAGPGVDADWVAAIWRAWAHLHGAAMSGWPWQAYTVAERAINLIDFASRHGLPGEPAETLDLLARHGEAIADNLEYFGEHYTSNHLSNNGRGLLRIGCAIGLPEYASLGAQIMVAEAGRIFGHSGMLREGSTHYHVLLTRNYIDAWLAAREAALPETDTLRRVAEQALGVIQGLRLPGGLPLVGDISPDCPPGFLASLAGVRANQPQWTDIKSADSLSGISALIAEISPVSPNRLAADGWHRFRRAGWSALLHVPPDGWPPMPGHGHHDLGSFELHWETQPVFVDPGRGSYREDPAYDPDVSGAAHNAVCIDDAAATPVNRPHYSDSFRSRVVGVPPTIEPIRNGFRLAHSGFTRLRGVGNAIREWFFTDGRIEIRDRIEGNRAHRVRRSYCTPLVAVRQGKTVDLTGNGIRMRMDLGGDVTIGPRTIWAAYGERREGTEIVCEETMRLPVDLVTVLERY